MDRENNLHITLATPIDDGSVAIALCDRAHGYG